MEDNKTLNNEQLEKVSGDANSSISSCKFTVGDKVTLFLYPEYGTGTVMATYMEGGVWKCRVKFEAGLMDAPDIEFSLA